MVCEILHLSSFIITRLCDLCVLCGSSSCIISPPKSTNPANGNYIIVDFASADMRGVPLRIFDLLGREVYRQEFPSGAKQIQIPIGSLAEGSYFVRIGSVARSFQRVK